LGLLRLKIDKLSLGYPREGNHEFLMEQKMRILDTWLLMSARPFPNFSNYVIYPTGAML